MVRCVLTVPVAVNSNECRLLGKEAPYLFKMKALKVPNPQCMQYDLVSDSIS